MDIFICLRRILKVSLQSLTTNLEVLKMADVNSVETEISRQLLRWAGHLM